MKSPIFPKIPKLAYCTITEYDTDNYGINKTTPLLTAGPNGGKLSQIFIKSLGAVTTASKIRLFLNNGSDYTDYKNNILFKEINIPVQTVSTISPNENIHDILDIQLPPYWRVLVGLYSVTGSNVNVTAIHSNY